MKGFFTLLLIGTFLSSHSQRSEQDAFRVADSLYQVLEQDSSKFCELIEEFSADIASINDCGVYDFAPGNMYVSPIAKLVRAQKDSRILPPVRTTYGYHLIQALGVRGEEIKFRHLLIDVARKH